MVYHQCRFWYGNTKTKMKPSCSPRRTGSEHVLSDLERSISKFDIWSGQVKVRSRSDHDPNRSVCTYSKAARRAKLFGAICASLPPSCRDLLTKNALWPHLSLGDLPVTHDRQLHRDHHGVRAVILKWFDGFGRFMRNGKHFHISP